MVVYVAASEGGIKSEAVRITKIMAFDPQDLEIEGYEVDAKNDQDCRDAIESQGHEIRYRVQYFNQRQLFPQVIRRDQFSLSCEGPNKRSRCCSFVKTVDTDAATRTDKRARRFSALSILEETHSRSQSPAVSTPTDLLGGFLLGGRADGVSPTNDTVPRQRSIFEQFLQPPSVRVKSMSHGQPAVLPPGAAFGTPTNAFDAISLDGSKKYSSGQPPVSVFPPSRDMSKGPLRPGRLGDLSPLNLVPRQRGFDGEQSQLVDALALANIAGPHEQ